MQFSNEKVYEIWKLVRGSEQFGRLSPRGTIFCPTQGAPYFNQNLTGNAGIWNRVNALASTEEDILSSDVRYN